MTTLSAFTPEDQDLLVKVPCLVGLWVSHADDNEGDQDDQVEYAQLKAIITKLAKRHTDDELVDDTLRALQSTFDNRDFHFDVDQIQTQVVAAVRIIATTASMTEAKAYASALLSIGTAVARAASEEAGYEGANDTDDSFISRVTAQAGALWSKVVATVNTEMNISPAEDSVLNDLSQTLRRALGAKH